MTFNSLSRLLGGGEKIRRWRNVATGCFVLLFYAVLFYAVALAKLGPGVLKWPL